MSLRSLGPVALVAVLACPAQAQLPDTAAAERLIVEATNDFRRDEGLEPVKPDPLLGRTARDFAVYMANTDRYGHVADGRDPAERARIHKYEACFIAENIAFQFNSAGFRTAELARSYVEGWKHSPEHRKNMLASAATGTGVAIARSDRSGRYYAVQMFGRPKAERVEFRIANAAPRAVKYRVGQQDYSLGPREARIHWLCGPEDLTLAGAHGAKLRPGHGDQLVVAGDANGVSIRRER
jgi:uncharacterized protein YkwD